jgi:hypothetical protein
MQEKADQAMEQSGPETKEAEDNSLVGSSAEAQPGRTPSGTDREPPEGLPTATGFPDRSEDEDLEAGKSDRGGGDTGMSAAHESVASEGGKESA